MDGFYINIQVMDDPIAQLDLNLLRTLEVLLRTHSVTLSARELGRSQPAVSYALARLREALSDPLLVRAGRGMVPTPRAEALRPGVEALLLDLRRILTAGARFDPRTARRTFTLACPDMIAPVVPRILEALSDAPGIDLSLQVGSSVFALEAGAELVLGQLPEEAPGVVARRLGIFEERVALRRGHPALSEPWTPETYVCWPHIQVRTQGGAPSTMERALAAAGLQRRVGLTVPNFLLAPHVVARSDLLFTGADVLLEQVAVPLSLVLLPVPVPTPRHTAAALWPERLSADPGHRWFRGRVIGALEALFADAVDPACRG